MRTLALLSLTAAAIAVPSLAQAQHGSGSGVSWSQRGQHARQGERVIVRHGGPNMGQPGFRRDFRHIRRIGRGQFVPGFWMGPQFEVRNWQMFGFPQPMSGHRWVRYYDDAYMVDGRGRVRDGRHGTDWDRYGDRGWGYDENGIPVYVGDGDYHPDGRDHRWAEESEDWDYSEYGVDDGPVHGGCAPAPCGGRAPAYSGAHGGGCGPSPCGPRGRGHGGSRQGGYGYESGYGAGYGYESGYGASYGYGGAMVCCVTITETTVETGGSSMVVEEVVEERAVRQQVRRAHRRPPPRRPIRGERG